MPATAFEARRAWSHHEPTRVGETITPIINADHTMNTGNTDASQPDRVPSARAARTSLNTDELSRLKQELMQAEVRLAKARATVVSAEIDIKVINTRLREFMK